MQNVINMEDKVFYSYNEITKYFDVRVIMIEKNKYTIILSKKLGNTKEPSKLDKLIQSFNEFKTEQLKFNALVIKFMNNQIEFNAKQAETNTKQAEFNAKVIEFMNNQTKFNEYVLDVFNRNNIK